MANYYTRIIRIYSSSRFENIDIEAITKTVVRTATMSDLCYFVNKEEQCLDLKFESKRAGGEINLDYGRFDVWEIRENQVFHNDVNYGYKDVTFGFDEIHFDSTNEILNHEFFNYFMVLKSSGRAKEENGVLIIKEKGSYHTGIYYDIKFEDSKERIRQVDLDMFLEPREDICNIDGILDNENVAKDLDRFYFFAFLNPHDKEVFKLYDGFRSVKLLWKGRPVNIAYKTETYWNGKNSDWWDNCLLPEWLSFRERRKLNFNK